MPQTRNPKQKNSTPPLPEPCHGSAQGPQKIHNCREQLGCRRPRIPNRKTQPLHSQSPAMEVRRDARKSTIVENSWDAGDPESQTEKLNPSTPRALPWKCAGTPENPQLSRTAGMPQTRNPKQKNSTPPLPGSAQGPKKIHKRKQSARPARLGRGVPNPCLSHPPKLSSPPSA